MATGDRRFSLKRILFGSISRKLIFYLVLASVFLSVIGVYILFRFSDAILTDMVSADLEAVAVSRTRHIETFLDAMKGRMTDFASDGKIKDCLYDLDNDIVDGCTPEELSRHLIQNKLPAVKGLYEVFALDELGRIAAATDVKRGSGEDLSMDPVFSEGRQDAFMKDIFFDSEYNHTGLAVSAPVMRDGEFVGVIVGKIQPEELYSILLEGTGELYLVNK